MIDRYSEKIAQALQEIADDREAAGRLVSDLRSWADFVVELHALVAEEIPPPPHERHASEWTC